MRIRIFNGTIASASTKGCFADALRLVYGSVPAWLRIVYFAQDLYRFQTPAWADPEVHPALEAYASCMRANGYDVHFPQEAIDWAQRQFGARPSTNSASESEIAQAIADANCQQSSAIVRVYETTLVRLASAWIMVNRDALIRIAALRTESLRRARAILAASVAIRQAAQGWWEGLTLAGKASLESGNEPSAMGDRMTTASGGSAATPGRLPRIAAPAQAGHGGDDSLLSGESITKRFGRGSTALDDVSLRVKGGEVVALLGRSGSGKSTLLLCLAGVIAPDAGRIRYGERSFDEMSDGELAKLRRSEFGFVFQAGHLLAELTAIENVALPLLLNSASRGVAYDDAAAQLAQLGITDLARKRRGEMSGGEAQRVAIARALVTRPRIIFADEPTGSLDSRNGELVMQLLTQAARAQGATVLVVTHDPHVASYGDREVHLRDGKIVSPAEAL